jgi:hypothetical protein
LSPKLVRGLYVSALANYVERAYPDDQRRTFAATLPADLRSLLPAIVADAWYPLPFVTGQCQAICLLAGGLPAARPELIRAGRYVGEEATASFLRLTLKTLSLPQLRRLFPELWSRYHNWGALTEPAASPARLALAVEDGSYDFLPYIATGWLEHFFGALGKKVRVASNCPSHERAVDGLRFDLDWDDAPHAETGPAHPGGPTRS